MEIDKSLKNSFKDEKVVGYGYLANNLLHLALTKKSEKNPGSSQMSTLWDDIKIRKSHFWAQLWYSHFK